MTPLNEQAIRKRILMFFFAFVIGLGTGSLACYARPGQDWTFFEIDPAMVRVARAAIGSAP